jgi:fructose-1-phosphate kinase PfkB-like protein
MKFIQLITDLTVMKQANSGDAVVAGILEGIDQHELPILTLEAIEAADDLSCVRYKWNMGDRNYREKMFICTQ